MVTIFTPTYNRAYTLTRLYESLIRQTNLNFEWLIVDDGSTDNTEELIKKYNNEKKIQIRYIKQENQGKMAAHNVGVRECKGNLFTCIDSDDYLTENAVEIIIKEWDDVKKNPRCVGIVGKCIYKDGKSVGTDMPSNVRYSTLNDLYSKYKYRGDTILIFKTEEIKKYEFPKINGEKFIPETYLYDKIDQDGELAIIKDGIYVCEYLQDGYTAKSSKVIKENPKGYILMAEQRLKISKKFKDKIKAAAQVVLGNWLANNKCFIKKSNNKVLLVLSMPFAYAIYVKKYK